MKTRITNSLALFVAACLLLWGTQALAGKPAAPKQYIFSRSTTQRTSSSLGITGVPAYVNMPNGSQYRGIYVTAASSGMGLSMGLRPGAVLVTINGRGVESISSLDSTVGSAGTNLSYAYVKMVDGLPKLYNKNSSSGRTPESGLGMAGPRTDDARNDFGIKIDDSTPVSQLESQMFNQLNKDRQQNGKPAISSNSRLASLARTYAEFLLTHNEFAHVDSRGKNPNDRAKDAGITSGVSENLAFQSRGIKTDAKCVADAEAAFMNEPPNQQNHRGNILADEAQTVGVGMARNRSRIMMVQEFSQTNP